MIRLIIKHFGTEMHRLIIKYFGTEMLVPDAGFCCTDGGGVDGTGLIGVLRKLF